MSTEDDLPLSITHGPHIAPRTVPIEKYEVAIRLIKDVLTAWEQSSNFSAYFTEQFIPWADEVVKND